MFLLNCGLRILTVVLLTLGYFTQHWQTVRKPGREITPQTVNRETKRTCRVFFLNGTKGCGYLPSLWAGTPFEEGKYGLVDKLNILVIL